tara:strand:+ start:12428 stop:13156 length:729 start_codon:yes stop_codon:yes gene_type:complete
MNSFTRTITLACATALAALTSTTASAQSKGLVYYGLQMEELEYRAGDEGEKLLVWDGDAFIGTDELKLRWLGSGEQDLGEGKLGKLENRLVLQTPVSDFFDIKGGLRYDSPDGPNRVYGVVGLAGLAKQWFEIDADLYVSEKGDASARLDAEYEVLLTNWLILTPSATFGIAATDDREAGVGAGLSDIEVGLRLSYDVVDRMISPYVGIVYERKFGKTAGFARDEDEAVDSTFAVVGLRLQF